MSLLQQQSLVEKIKLSIVVSIETIINKQYTYQKNPFSRINTYLQTSADRLFSVD